MKCGDEAVFMRLKSETYAETLKRHNTNVFYFVITTYTLLKRLSINRYSDLGL